MANIQVLAEKMCSADKDFRYMACNDLLVEIKKPEFKLAERMERKVCFVVESHSLQLVDQLLKLLLGDVNSEVQHLAVKWSEIFARGLMCAVLRCWPRRLFPKLLTKSSRNWSGAWESRKTSCATFAASVFTLRHFKFFVRSLCFLLSFMFRHVLTLFSL